VYILNFRKNKFGLKLENKDI